MAHTDKTQPLKFRMNEPDFTWRKTSYPERTVNLGRGHTKFYKRLSHKRNRKRAIPYTRMGAYGWGIENIRYCFED